MALNLPPAWARMLGNNSFLTSNRTATPHFDQQGNRISADAAWAAANPRAAAAQAGGGLGMAAANPNAAPNGMPSGMQIGGMMPQGGGMPGPMDNIQKPLSPYAPGTGYPTQPGGMQDPRMLQAQVMQPPGGFQMPQNGMSPLAYMQQMQRTGSPMMPSPQTPMNPMARGMFRAQPQMQGLGGLNQMGLLGSSAPMMNQFNQRRPAVSGMNPNWQGSAVQYARGGPVYRR